MENNEQATIFIRHGDVALKVIENGYFYDLVSVRPDTKWRGKKVYYFVNKPEIRKIVDDAYTAFKATLTSQEGNKE